MELVTETQRTELEALLRIGRGTLHALDRSLRFETSPSKRLDLYEGRSLVMADVARLTEALGA